MSADHAPLRVYHIGRWRYLWIWFVFGTLALVFFGMALLPGKPDERAGCFIGGILFFAVTLFVHVLVRFARLELSENGVCLRQIGYRLEAPWSDVTELWLDRGHEGLVTSRPVGGKGRNLLAVSGRAMSHTLIGSGLYTAKQQALLDEGRLIPIEAFAWHLRHGQLRGDLDHFAPHLNARLAGLDAPGAPTTSPAEHVPKKQPTRPLSARDWLILAVIALGIAGMFAFAASSPVHKRLLETFGVALFSGSFALRLAIGARTCYRIGSWLAGTGLGVVSALLALWSLTELAKLADSFGHGNPGAPLLGTLFFGIVAFIAGSGANKAFHRHHWFMGAVLSLVAAFVVLCTAFSVADLVKSLR